MHNLPTIAERRPANSRAPHPAVHGGAKIVGLLEQSGDARTQRPRKTGGRQGKSESRTRAPRY